MYFNRFDIVEAHYAFYSDYHQGQASYYYSRLCKISLYYRPGISYNGYYSLSENSKMIYDDLVYKHEQEGQSYQEYRNRLFN